MSLTAAIHVPKVACRRKDGSDDLSLSFSHKSSPPPTLYNSMAAYMLQIPPSITAFLCVCHVWLVELPITFTLQLHVSLPIYCFDHYLTWAIYGTFICSLSLFSYFHTSRRISLFSQYLMLIIILNH